MQYCAQPACSVLVARGRCQKHARQADQGTRGTAHERGYTSGWAAYSRAFRKDHPTCGERADGTLDHVHSRCVQQGLTTPAECVDHTVPVTQGGAFWDPMNHMACCLACNTWKANTLEREHAS
jgi:5-methylcytosine-specific restriction protein A